MECNICGGTEFGVYKNRGRIQCTKCGSIERTRLLKMYLDKFAGLRGGIRVLHFAPERPLFKAIANTVGDGYHIRDINIRRYASLSLGVVSIEKFDLCTDVAALPSNHYDLILHNHVLEHLPCNITAVLWHLHRALSPTGLHMFSIPIVPGRYEESLSEMSPEAREERFHHPEHYRNFGRDDLLHTIGMVFDIEAQLKSSPVDIFGEEMFVRYNIPRSRWSRFSGATPFVLKKADLKLQQLSSPSMANSTSQKAEGHSELAQPTPQSFSAALFKNLESSRKQSPDSYFCPACGTLSTAFKKGGTSGRSNAKCPVCGTLERHRLFWVYFVNSIWPRLPKGTKKLLHIAPEPIFTRLFQSSNSIEYLSGDLTMPSAMIKLDLTNIQLPNDQFDVIVCLHIMEHIPDDRKAMTEMFRVTKPGGFLLVMVPTYGQSTYEDFNITAPEDRLSHFGQDDHVRKYGMDIMDRLSAVGFKVSIWPKAEEFGPELAKFIRAGRRIIFECRK